MDTQKLIQPPHLQRFSPSTVNALASCPFRVGLIRAGLAESRPSPFTALGNVAHAMHEMGWKGVFAGVPEAVIDTELATAWERLCEEQYLKLKDIALGPLAPPEPSDWPGYELTRARTLRRVRQIRVMGQQPPFDGWARAEVGLVDKETGLEGRLDRLQHRNGELRIVDLKSGIWQGEVTPDQRQQLLLYAALVHSSLGQWPETLVIETAAGHETHLAVDRDEVENALATARDLVEQFNAATSRGWPALEELAKPADDTCRHCPARLVCEPYWRALTSEWRFHGSVRGVVAERLEPGEWIAVALSTASPHDRMGLKTVVYRVGLVIREGMALSVVGAEQRGDPGALRVRWDTQIRLG